MKDSYFNSITISRKKFLWIIQIGLVSFVLLKSILVITETAIKSWRYCPQVMNGAKSDIQPYLDRFSELRMFLPASSNLSYLSDIEQDMTEPYHFYLAQIALAPRVLHLSDSEEFILFNRHKKKREINLFHMGYRPIFISSKGPEVWIRT